MHFFVVMSFFIKLTWTHHLRSHFSFNTAAGTLFLFVDELPITHAHSSLDSVWSGALWCHSRVESVERWMRENRVRGQTDCAAAPPLLLIRINVCESLTGRTASWLINTSNDLYPWHPSDQTAERTQFQSFSDLIMINQSECDIAAERLTVSTASGSEHFSPLIQTPMMPCLNHAPAWLSTFCHRCLHGYNMLIARCAVHTWRLDEQFYQVNTVVTF